MYTVLSFIFYFTREPVGWVQDYTFWAEWYKLCRLVRVLKRLPFHTNDEKSAVSY